MRLTDLDPRWLFDESGVRIGFSFLSPTKPDFRQTCFAAPSPIRKQFEAFWRDQGILDADEDTRDRALVKPQTYQPCNQKSKWDFVGGIENATFDALSVTPSIDGSAGGAWHGHITNGEIVGGI